MVQILSLITVAVLTRSIFAAPLSRRSQHENNYDDREREDLDYNRYYDNSYQQESNQDNNYEYNNNYEDNNRDRYDENDDQSIELDVTRIIIDHEDSYNTEDYVRPSETDVYGSGSNNWGNDYNDCVAKCNARFGGNQDVLRQNEPSGAIHTVLVAPTGSGLRYVPFALNATVGDTVRFVWSTSNNHTATLSSELAICNKSDLAAERNFVSGVRNGQQNFDVVVQTAEPQFFYCSVKEHCQQGMFGIINPASDFGGRNSVGAMMNSFMDSNPDLRATWDYMSQGVAGTSAENWGYDIDLTGIPEDVYSQIASNVLFTQAQFAANPGMLETNLGAATPDGSPVLITPTFSNLLSNSNQDPNQNLGAPNGTRTGSEPDPTGLTVVPISSNDAMGNVRVQGSLVMGLMMMATWLLF